MFDIGIAFKFVDSDNFGKNQTRHGMADIPKISPLLDFLYGEFKSQIQWITVGIQIPQPEFLVNTIQMVRMVKRCLLCLIVWVFSGI